VDESELLKHLAASSDAELVRVLLSDEYRAEARGAAAALLRHRFPRLGLPAATEPRALADSVVTALIERSVRCHLCVSAPVIAERYPFLVCRPVVGTVDNALALGEILLPGISWLRKAHYDVVPLILNLCDSCAGVRDEVTKELCRENPLVGLLEWLYGFTEIKWPNELDDDQRSDGGPSRLTPGVRVLTTAGVGVIRRVTPAGQAVIDLDTGGTVTENVHRIVACPDDPESGFAGR
jgi:hypothetical protein